MEGSFSQAGFFYQNHIAAQKVLELLEFGSQYKSIYLENYRKGNHIDDIIINSSDATYYYQVKWSLDIDNSYTIYNLLTPSDSKDPKSKSLIRELAEGYSKLPDKANAQVILFSTKKIGNQKYTKKGIDKSLSDFIEQIHIPFINSNEFKKLSDLPNYAEFKAVIEKLRESSELDEITFDNFIKSLKFELAQPDKEQQKERLLYKLELLGIDRKIYETLLTAVVEWSIKGTAIFANDVLERLGLSNRFLDSVTHNFKVEKQYFVSNPRLFSKLDNAVENLDGGFILLEGPPGSGKSTNLTEYQETTSNVKFAYYCFIPDEVELGNRRLEKETFLKSLCIGIKNSFPGVDFPELYSQNYEDKLMKWLHVISEEGSKVIFVIDGLDHVDKRKNSLSQPITSYLDGKLPENVFFLLSSQYPEALSQEIQLQIQQDEKRHIKIEKFSEGETQSFLELRGFSPTPEILTLAYKKSEGIPLYLHYITSLLLELPSNNYIYEQFLEDLPHLENSKIDTYHEFLYGQVKANNLAVWILAILANRREFTSNETLLELLSILGVQSDLVQLDNQLSTFRHLLRRVDGRGYTIFHNSFREFILKKQKNLSNKIDSAIIEYYKSNPDNDETYRNYYRHLFELNRFQEILNDCNEEWLERSWKSFRPFEEISYNLNLAWQSSAKLLSLREFIRIAFLEQKFGRASFNFEYTENYKSAKFLLDINKQEEAIRGIWNGEQIKVSSTDFYNFVIAFYKKTKARLPNRIANIGFAQFNKKTNGEETEARFKARALYDNWKILFSEISEYKWRNYDEHNHKVTPFSPEENSYTNNNIKKKIIDVLFLSQDYSGLLEISQDLDCNSEVRNYALFRVIILLIKTQNHEEAKSILQEVDLNVFQEKAHNSLIISLAESGLYADISNIAKASYPPPTLFAGLIKKEPDFGIKKELLNLYNKLRIYFLQNPQDINSYKIKAQSFDVLECSFFTASIELAELWLNTINLRVSDREKCDAIKKILSELNVDYKVREQKLREILYTGEHYLRTGIDKIHINIFNYVANHLAPSYALEVISHWLILDEGQNGYRNLNSSLVFAKLLDEKKDSLFKDSILKLIKWSETIARYDEETLPLMEGLVKCAGAYGQCGFDTEAIRLWNELFYLACGVHDRKDYQFSEAIYILQRAHKNHPENSVGRIERLLTLAHQIKGAADGRAVARAIDDIINFSAEISPALALEFLHKEGWAFRDEVIELFSKSFPNLPNIDLKYLWAIIKTMPKWENYRDYNEDTYPAMRNIFKACINKKELSLSEEIYSFVRKQLLIEKGMSYRIYEFAHIAVSNGIFISDVKHDHKNYEAIWQKSLEDKRQSESSQINSKPKLEIDFPTLEELHQISENNFAEFKKWLESIAYRYWQIEIKEGLKRAYSTLKEEFNRFLQLYPETERESDYFYIKCFAILKKKLLKLDYTNPQDFKKEVENAFADLLKNIFQSNSDDFWEDKIQRVFNYKQWLKTFILQISHPDYEFERYVLDKYFPQLIELSSLKNLKSWETVCKRHINSYKLRDILLMIAERLKSIDEAYSLKLLSEVWESNKSFFFSSDIETISSYLKIFFDIQPEKAKNVLLENFIIQYKSYPKDIIYNLDKVLDYAEFFDEPDIYEFSYEEYEKYNEMLAQGLSEKPVSYEWLKKFPLQQSFEYSAIQYLVRLFNYPEVEIRKLALSSLFELIKEESLVIEHLVEICVKEDENIKEHFLSLLYSVALLDYKMILPFKDQLFALVEDGHFNISQSVKEILSYCLEQGAEFSHSELAKLNSINIKPLIALPVLEEGRLNSGRRFLPNSYQSTLLYNMHLRNKDGEQLMDKLYTKLLQLGWTTSTGMEEESKTLRAHDLNTNFDNIEINGPYFQSVQKALNELFVKEIRKENYENRDIQNLKQVFRLYDPSELFTQTVQKPEYVNWIGKDVDGEQFLNFSDVESYIINFQERDEDWITLYEDGHQRSNDDDDLPRARRTVYFTVTAFLADKTLFSENDITELFESFKSNFPIPYIPAENLYRNEILNIFPSSVSYPFEEVRPIIGISANKFRGQDELSIATLLPDFVEELNIAPENDYSLNYVMGNEQIVKFINWQEPYDQDRRRQKAKSAGIMLNIKKDELENYLEENNLILCYIVTLRRTTDIHKPEDEMDWESYDSIFFGQQFLRIA